MLIQSFGFYHNKKAITKQGENPFLAYNKILRILGLSIPVKKCADNDELCNMDRCNLNSQQDCSPRDIHKTSTTDTVDDHSGIGAGMHKFIFSWDHNIKFDYEKKLNEIKILVLYKSIIGNEDLCLFYDNKNKGQIQIRGDECKKIANDPEAYLAKN